MSRIADAARVIREAQSGLHVESSILEEAINVAVDETSRTYSSIADDYITARAEGEWDKSREYSALLLATVREQIVRGRLEPETDGTWYMLDVGAGDGKASERFAQEPDIRSISVDNSPQFLKHLHGKERRGEIPPHSVVDADMRTLQPVPSASVQCVRNHASLHHLPLVGDRLGAAAAVAASRRVLKPGGIFHVFVKAGEGIAAIDTNEGLGSRFYQLFSVDTIVELLARNKFRVLFVEQSVEIRAGAEIPWIFALAAST